jgi:hypothetical protein
MARNDSRESSDIDLLLITRQELRRREVKKMVPTTLLPKDWHLSLSIYPEAQFVSAHEHGTLFMVHLLKEGKILYDDGFYRQLCLRPFEPSKSALKMNLKILKQRLEIADDLRKFNNLFIGVLADFFSISKNLAYNLLAMNGQFIFNKKRAFAVLAEKYPRYKKEIQELQSLEPFFLRNAKGIPTPLPFNPINCEEKVIEIREHIKELLVLGDNKN